MFTLPVQSEVHRNPRIWQNIDVYILLNPYKIKQRSAFWIVHQNQRLFLLVQELYNLISRWLNMPELESNRIRALRNFWRVYCLFHGRIAGIIMNI